MAGEFDMLAEARTIETVVIIGPLDLLGSANGLNVGEAPLPPGSTEARPWSRRARPNAMQMLVNGMALERWEESYSISGSSEPHLGSRSCAVLSPDAPARCGQGEVLRKVKRPF